MERYILGHSGPACKKHINKCVFNDMIELARVYPFLDSRIDRRSFAHLRDSGKAVKIGHSCAAVSHHRPITAPDSGAGKANRDSHPGEGEGRGKAETT
jgi:hypothetical protein